MEIGTADCWAPGDQEHDHQMCEDTNTERAIEEALAFAPPDARVAARAAIDSMIREARLSGLTAGAEIGDPTAPVHDDPDPIEYCERCCGYRTDPHRCDDVPSR